MNAAHRLRHFPRWLWLWIPIAYLPFESIVRAIDREGVAYERIFMHEYGFVETATAVLLVPAVLLSMRRAAQLWRDRTILAGSLVLLFALGCLFLLGEEISYGQHIFRWETPQYFEVHNTQKETNLHNLKSINKSRMKWALLFGMLMVAIVLPLILRSHGVPERVARSPLGPLLISGTVCVPVAAMAIGMHLLVKALYWLYDFEFHDNGFIDMRETTELYIAYFLFLYSLALFRKMDVSHDRNVEHAAT